LGSSEEYSREDIRNLVGVLVELYYVILSLNPIVHELTRIQAKGYEISLPLDLVRNTLLVAKLAKVLKEIWKAIYSPTRLLVEELKISNIIEGRIDVPLTSKLMGQGLQLVASRKSKLALDSIENVFLKAFLEKLRNDAEKFLYNIEGFECDDIIYEEVFKTFTKNIVEKLTIIRNSIREVNEKTFLKHVRISRSLLEDRGLKRIAWKVLERNIYPYNSIALWALEYIKTNMLVLLTKYSRNAREIGNLKLGLWDYKLYEIYSYYIVAYVTAKVFNAHLIAMWKDEILLSSREYDVKITYDKAPECKSWIAHGKYFMLNNSDVRVPAGRPDIAVHVNSVVASVCDAKYRVSAKELSESRFKVLGYMHEYDVPFGALVFDPTHVKPVLTVDSEVEENIVFLEETMKYGGVIIEDRNKTLYLVALKPKPFTELVGSKEYRILENMVKKFTIVK